MSKLTRLQVVNFTKVDGIDREKLPGASSSLPSFPSEKACPLHPIAKDPK